MRNPRGLKLWGNDSAHLKAAEKLIDMGIFQYIEVMPLKESYVEPFANGLPYVIHWTHEQHGTNLGDRAKHVYTREMLVKAFDWADILKAKLVVVHPGYGEPEATIEILDDFRDDRLCLENMPMYAITGQKLLGYTIEEMKYLMGGRARFCMDFGHAMKAAIPLKIKEKDFIHQMCAELKPSLFHLSDGTRKASYDDHLSLFKGDFDIGFFKRVIKTWPGVPVSFETTRLPGTLSEDVRNVVRYLEI